MGSLEPFFGNVQAGCSVLGASPPALSAALRGRRLRALGPRGGRRPRGAAGAAAGGAVFGGREGGARWVRSPFGVEMEWELGATDCVFGASGAYCRFAPLRLSVDLLGRFCLGKSG